MVFAWSLAYFTHFHSHINIVHILCIHCAHIYDIEVENCNKLRRLYSNIWNYVATKYNVFMVCVKWHYIWHEFTMKQMFGTFWRTFLRVFRRNWMRCHRRNSRDVLRCVLDKTPGVLFDIMDPEGDPNPPPPTVGSADWCVCSNCNQMPTLAERVCCGYQPQHCITSWPVSS